VSGPLPVSEVGGPVVAEAAGAGLRIGDAAARVGLSARALRYYEELGLLTPSGHTAGGERRYGPGDLERLERIVELRDVLGMNLDEVKGFLDTETQLDHVRQAYRARKSDETPAARAQRRELLEEILRLSESLADQLAAKVERMQAFRADLLKRADRCRELLRDL
jgi:DNA-binding transcriptional MerR regulator